MIPAFDWKSCTAACREAGTPLDGISPVKMLLIRGRDAYIDAMNQGSAKLSTERSPRPPSLIFSFACSHESLLMSTLQIFTSVSRIRLSIFVSAFDAL